MLIQVLAGTTSGTTVALLTNPLDVIRANVQVSSDQMRLLRHVVTLFATQVQRTSYKAALRILWKEERFTVFTKGLSARMTQSCISSACIVAGYETLKRWSLLDEYKDQVRW